jgi:hypothetical protein
MIGPVGFWRASEAPKLYIRAAFKTKATVAHVMWRTGGADARGLGRNNVAFKIIGDGKYRTYEIDLSASPKYKGAITQFRFDPVPSGATGDYVKVQSIAFTRPEKRQ